MRGREGEKERGREGEDKHSGCVGACMSWCSYKGQGVYAVSSFLPSLCRFWQVPLPAEPSLSSSANFLNLDLMLFLFACTGVFICSHVCVCEEPCVYGGLWSTLAVTLEVLFTFICKEFLPALELSQ